MLSFFFTLSFCVRRLKIFFLVLFFPHFALFSHVHTNRIKLQLNGTFYSTANPLEIGMEIVFFFLFFLPTIFL